MKKVVLLLVLASLFMGSALFAEDPSNIFGESGYYYFNYPIETIYTHSLGYLIVYRKNSNFMGRTFVPLEWFTGKSDKGEIVFLGSGTEWPSMTVYFRDGEFSHVRLRLRRHRAHESWAFAPSNLDLNRHFQDIEELVLQH